MRVTVSVAGEGEAREAEVPETATYGDLIDAVGLSPQEATALVDGRPVPEDAAVEADRVDVIRLVRGG